MKRKAFNVNWERDFKLDSIQIESILNKLVPLIAAPEDHDFFRGVLRVKFENSFSSEVALFVNKLLKGENI